VYKVLVHTVSGYETNSPSAVVEASIGAVSSADIVFCRFEGGAGEVMLDVVCVDEKEETARCMDVRYRFTSFLMTNNELCCCCC
jgi:hypothetical protein